MTTNIVLRGVLGELIFVFDRSFGRLKTTRTTLTPTRSHTYATLGTVGQGKQGKQFGDDCGFTLHGYFTTTGGSTMDKVFFGGLILFFVQGILGSSVVPFVGGTFFFFGLGTTFAGRFFDFLYGYQDYQGTKEFGTYGVSGVVLYGTSSRVVGVHCHSSANGIPSVFSRESEKGKFGDLFAGGVGTYNFNKNIILVPIVDVKARCGVSIGH